MGFLLALLRDGIYITSLDVDNAIYTTSTIEHLPRKTQGKAIILAILIEFLARLGLIALFGLVLNGTRPLFVLFGIEFSVETISLFTAGIFLLVKNSQELIDFFRRRQAAEKHRYDLKQVSFRWMLVEMSTVNIVLSVDTIIAIGAAGNGLGWILYVLAFSAVVRLLFIEEIARLIQKYPAINIIILTLLVLIGIELIIQGFGIDFEQPFNVVMVLSIIAAIIYHWWYRQNSSISSSGT